MKGIVNMNKNNIKNIEFINPKIIDTLILLSNEYSITFDAIVNIAVLKFIDDISLLRMLRTGGIDIISLSERVLFSQHQ